MRGPNTFTMHGGFIIFLTLSQLISPPTRGLRNSFPAAYSAKLPKQRITKTTSLCAIANMAPSTRRTARPTTPDRPIRAAEATTREKIEFFKDYDCDHGDKTLASISAPYYITDRTARNWLKDRKELGSPAYHYIRKLSKVLGRRSRVSKEVVNMLLSPSRNPVRTQRLEAQIKYHNINIRP